ncbi:hypothetical protein FAF44_03045 [Nonomuraea sp. MG754425]|uniref:hypothetical protein n=1 Tax=Nonomuraea sp. MG754425 TaxID=2570319 RepID=UPI001F352330|nr:hypothetical protein [Nonomuraea sp. MG754425]MCF6467392.1 hypothetical protein [Nonomuraea sp. MG754425]
MMAQVRDRKAGAGSGASFSTLTPAFQPGDILVAAHSCDIGTPANMSISGTWNEIPPIGMVGPTFNTRAYWKPAGSDPASYTFTQDSGADGVAVIASLMDLAGTAPLNLGESFVLNAATMTASSLTPAGAGDLALIWAGAVASPGAARTWSGPAGWTTEIQRQSGIYTAGIMVSKVLTSGEPTGAATFTASGAMYRGQTLVLTFRAGASAVQKNGSDAAAASEQGTVQAQLARTDAAAAADSGQAARLVADQAVLAEARTIDAAAQRLDSAQVSDTAATAGAAGRAETGVAADAAHLTSAISQADTAALSESAALTLTTHDQAAVTDGAGNQEILGPLVGDAVTTIEVAALAAPTAVGDAAGLGETARVDVGRSTSDSSAVIEQAVAGPLTAETGTTSETATVRVLLDRADAGAVADDAAAGQPTGVSDSAALLETALVVDLGREITGVDGPHRTWSATLARRQWSADPPRRTWSASRT